MHEPVAPTTSRDSPVESGLLNDIVNAPDLATAAEHLGVNGIPVFPCVPGGKRPLTAHGFQDASAERDVIDFWWRRHPGANIGVPTGAAGGVDVVDVDVHKTDPDTPPSSTHGGPVSSKAGLGWSAPRQAGCTPTSSTQASASSGRGRCRASTSTSGATAATSSSRPPG